MNKFASILIVQTSVLGSILSLALTNLRFTEFFGFGELFITFSIVLFIFSAKIDNFKNIRNKIPVNFLLSFVVINFVALVYVLFFVPFLHSNLYYEGFSRTFIAYLFGIINAIVLFLTIKTDQIDFLFKTFLKYFNLTYIATYLLLFGVLISELASGERFHGFALNPNQHGTLLVAIPFIGMYLYNRTAISLNYLLLTLMVSSILIKSIISDAVYYSLFSCFFLLIIIKIKLIKFEAKIFIFFLSIIIFYFYVYDNLIDYILDTNQNADQASVRFVLWNNGFQAFLKSPLIGFGSGAFSGDYIPFSFMECHNTFIDLLTNVGCIGLLFYLNFLFKTIKTNFLKKDIYLILILLSVVFFSFFHNILRHPTFWLILLSVYYVSKNKNESSLITK